MAIEHQRYCESDGYSGSSISSTLRDGHSDFVSPFCRNQTDSNLQINTFCERIVEKGQNPEVFVKRASISTLIELSDFAEISERCQIFCIRQKNSYSRLYISQEAFEQLILAYSIFSRIWDFALQFSSKTRESDIGHAPFRFRQLDPVLLDDGCLGSFECVYGFRYVVLNHRDEQMKEDPDHNPWSIRQSVIYQQYNSAKNKVTLVLIAPAEIARKHVEDEVRRSLTKKKRLNPFDLHRILISTLYENWRNYIRNLERCLQFQSDRITLSHVQSQSERLSPQTHFALKFLDRQRLKKMEDQILDLVIIFESLHNTLTQLRRQCQDHCLRELCMNCTCGGIVSEFEEQINETQMNLRKTEILHKRAQNTAQLLSDLLDYENTQIALLNEKLLNGLVKETKDENSKMRILTERSTQDATAVKILTVITLIYLPMTVVANFFSSQLIRVDDSGQISVVSASWWFAVVAAPLTVVTFLLWKFWLSYSIRKQERKEQVQIEYEKNGMIEPCSSGSGKKEKLDWMRGRLAAFRKQCRGLVADDSA